MKAMDMKNRIDLELRGKDRATIKELNLDSCRGQQIEGLTDEFKSLEVLSMINVGLTNLRGFPKLPSLNKVFKKIYSLEKLEKKIEHQKIKA
jgi:acidic leucine-rich nuclear phosphoprotein 32 family protein A/C/D